MGWRNFHHSLGVFWPVATVILQMMPGLGQKYVQTHLAKFNMGAIWETLQIADDPSDEIIRVPCDTHEWSWWSVMFPILRSCILPRMQFAIISRNIWPEGHPLNMRPTEWLHVWNSSPMRQPASLYVLSVSYIFFLYVMMAQCMHRNHRGMYMALPHFIYMFWTFRLIVFT